MWIELTESVFRDSLTADELAGVRAAGLAEGQADTLAGTLAGVTRKVRGKVGACAKNTLGVGQTIPDELLTAACAIARVEFFSRIPGLKELLDETRMELFRAALRDLDAAARGDFAIEQPATVSSEVVSGPAVQLVESRARTATRAKMEGL
jgi:hypothetical protein